jgi:hypothetical protein
MRHADQNRPQTNAKYVGTKVSSGSNNATRVALHQSHTHNRQSEGQASERAAHLEDEVRVRALKKFALRKQFEEHRKQKQLETKGNQRGIKR